MLIALCREVWHHNVYTHTASALLHVSASFGHHQKMFDKTKEKTTLDNCVIDVQM
jgi:hypothetical protein